MPKKLYHDTKVESWALWFCLPPLAPIFKMKYVITFILTILTLISNSQCLDKYLVAANRSSAEYFLYNTYCTGNQNIVEDSVSDYIKEKVKKYLLDRTNSAFINRIECKSLKILKFDITEAKARTNEFDQKRCENIKYLFSFLWNCQAAGNYWFYISTDSIGSILSRNMIPDMLKNPNFESIISFCEVEKIIKTNKKLKKKPIKKVIFDYYDTENSFVWEVYLDVFEKEKGIYFQNYVMINANSGKIIKIDDKFYDVAF